MNTLKVGLIGCGGISAAHLGAHREYPDQFRYAAVCDVVEAIARRRATELGELPVYTDPDKMMTQADIDAVNI